MGVRPPGAAKLALLLACLLLHSQPASTKSWSKKGGGSTRRKYRDKAAAAAGRGGGGGGGAGGAGGGGGRGAEVGGKTDQIPWEQLAPMPATAAAAVGAAAAADAPLGLADPLGLPAEFWGRGWQRSPLHLRPPAGQPNRLAELMDMDGGDLDRLLGGEEPLELGRNAKFVMDGRKGKSSPGTRLTSQMAREMYQKRATLVVDQMEKVWPPVANLTERVEAAFGVQTEVNMYLTPPDARGFNCHFDFEDVFILQVRGSKVSRGLQLQSLWVIPTAAVS